MSEVHNCKFVGIEFSADALSSIKAITKALEINAKGLRENAAALASLASVFSSSNINIESLQIGPGVNGVQIKGHEITPNKQSFGDE